MRTRPTFRGAAGARLLLTLFFLLLVVAPLLRMFAYIDGDSLRRVWSTPAFGGAVVNSLVSAAAATVVSLTLGYLAAACLERSGVRGRGVFSVIFSLPMLIPSISNGMGLVILFGNNGILTRLLGLSSAIYGMNGIILGGVLYSFPVAFLMLSDVLRYEDSAPYEAARVLGISPARQFAAITLPYLRRPLISVVFAVFTMVVTDYGVPLMVGGKCQTLATLLYQEVIGQLDFGKGAVYGCLLLLPAVAAFVFDAVNRDRGNSVFTARPFDTARKPRRDALAALYCVLLSALVLLPLLSFVVLAFARQYPSDVSFTLANLSRAIGLKADRYLLNSVEIALGASLLGVAVAFAAAVLTARKPTRASRALHLAAITSAAIPGVVLGLSYVLAFKRSFLYGTMAILILVNLIHFFSSPYLMLVNSLSKLNENLEDVGSTLGVSRPRITFGVLLPQCRNTLLEAFSYFFVNCMMTISAVSFLAGTADKPVSLMINQFEAQMQLECAAVVSLAILAVNLLMKALIHILKKR